MTRLKYIEKVFPNYERNAFCSIYCVKDLFGSAVECKRPFDYGRVVCIACWEEEIGEGEVWKI